MQVNDQVIENRICTLTGKEFSITQKDIELYEKISPKFGKRSIDYTLPTLCPEERQRRRFAFRNERSLYRRQCDASKKPIISIYSPDKEYVVYDQKIRWSDDWDAMDYGSEFNFDKTFTEQFGELMRVVPRMSLVNMESENSEYCNPGFYNKDCYLSYCLTNSQNIYHSTWIEESKALIDSYFSIQCESSYELISCNNCFSCYGCYNCESCSFCLNCFDLKNVSFAVENVIVGKELYEKYIRENGIVVDQQILRNHDSLLSNRGSSAVSGKYLTNCADCYECFSIEGGKDLKYCQLGKCGAIDCIDVSLPMECSRVIESLSVFNQQTCFGSIFSWRSNNLLYTDLCFDCKNLFGCVGLRNKKYCVFNKQYTKEEYEKLVPKIIEHMKEAGERGEFFDPSLSPFGYNETVAQEYFPLEKSEAIRKGYKRNDYETPQPKVSKTVQGSQLPEKIVDVGDDILKIAIECEVTGKLFRIIPQELEFYRKHNIPLPRKHPDQRHLERLAMRK